VELTEERFPRLFGASFSTFPPPRFPNTLLVPNLCLGTYSGCKLSLLLRSCRGYGLETEFPQQSRSQTEFGNEDSRVWERGNHAWRGKNDEHALPIGGMTALQFCSATSLQHRSPACGGL